MRLILPHGCLCVPPLLRSELLPVASLRHALHFDVLVSFHLWVLRFALGVVQLEDDIVVGVGSIGVEVDSRRNYLNGREEFEGGSGGSGGVGIGDLP